MHRFPPPPLLPPPGLVPSSANSWMNDDDFPRFDQQPPNSKPIQQSIQQPNSEDPAKKKLVPPLMSLKIDKPNSNADNNNKLVEPVLPKILEDALALGAEKLKDVGRLQPKSQVTMQEYLNEIAVEGESDDDESSNFTTGSKEGRNKEKNRKKKNRKKENRKKRMNAQKQIQQENQENIQVEGHEISGEKEKMHINDEKVDVEYVPEKITVAELAPMYRQFYRIFEIFKLENKSKEAPLPVQTGRTVERFINFLERLINFKISFNFS